MTATAEIVSFLAKLPERNIPLTVWQEIELSFVDTVACMLDGVRFDAARIVASNALYSTSGPVSATLIGFGGDRSLLDVAAIHGVMAHVADYDDVSWALMGHPSATLVPALLPLAQYLGSSGEELALAYLAGYEVAAELGHATEPAHYLRGWHATSTIGSIAVAAAACRLLGHDEASVVAALGIAASSSSGLRQNFGSMVKSLHAGFAARNGLHAALLAQDGYTADSDALDGKWGFFGTFQDDAVAALRSDAFSAFSILDPGTLRKQYPSCGATHQAIEASRQIARANPIDWLDIESVEVAVAPACLAPLQERLPATPLEGKFSMQFCVATALLEGDVRSRHFSPDHLQSSAIQAVMPTVAMIPSPEYADIPENSNAASAAQVTVVTRAGARLQAERRYPTGAPESPMSPSDVRGKYFDCVEPVIGTDAAERSMAFLSNLRGQAQLTDLFRWLVP